MRDIKREDERVRKEWMKENERKGEIMTGENGTHTRYS